MSLARHVWGDGLSFPDRALARLYDLAKRDQWRIDGDIDWRRLDMATLPPSVRRSMAQIYTQIYYGETMGLMHLARAVGRVDSPWARQLGATQIMDESRHVEFFSRALASLGYQAGVSPHMVAFFEDLERCESPEQALFGIQVVLETTAQAVFAEGALLAQRARARAVKLPGSAGACEFLEALSRFVSRDEVRHVAIGVLYMRARWPELSRPERHTFEERAQRWSALLQAVVDDIALPLSHLGIEAASLSQRVASTRAKHLRAIGFTCPVAPRTRRL